MDCRGGVIAIFKRGALMALTAVTCVAFGNSAVVAGPLKNLERGIIVDIGRRGCRAVRGDREHVPGGRRRPASSVRSRRWPARPKPRWPAGPESERRCARTSRWRVSLRPARLRRDRRRARQHQPPDRPGYRGRLVCRRRPGRQPHGRAGVRRDERHLQRPHGPLRRGRSARCPATSFRMLPVRRCRSAERSACRSPSISGASARTRGGVRRPTTWPTMAGSVFPGWRREVAADADRAPRAELRKPVSTSPRVARSSGLGPVAAPPARDLLHFLRGRAGVPCFAPFGYDPPEATPSPSTPVR